MASSGDLLVWSADISKEDVAMRFVLIILKDDRQLEYVTISTRNATVKIFNIDRYDLTRLKNLDNIHFLREDLWDTL